MSKYASTVQTPRIGWTCANCLGGNQRNFNRLCRKYCRIRSEFLCSFRAYSEKASCTIVCSFAYKTVPTHCFVGVDRNSSACLLVMILTLKQVLRVLAQVEIHKTVVQIVLMARSSRSISPCEKSRKFAAWDGTTMNEIRC